MVHFIAMKLADYMRVNNVTDVALAAKLGVASTTVLRWRRGFTKPDWPVVPEIAKYTNGKVMANDFADYDIAELEPHLSIASAKGG